ncbi:hypothetical protein GCM10010269_33890 [Streptomyces humidus]|uniref:Caspase domain-containing protein n=1 Tax=Streptomyces humidus TaxID=52259 RepID=A0A918L3T1_9ACTN|nr:ATP-binding protein [Streptomyces humidus]GGR91945.1 hypothetical protein GCM10010269_33890 [Streptomyces humidus]
MAERAGYFCISGRPAYGGDFDDLKLLPREVRDVRRELRALGLTEPFAGAGGPAEGDALSHLDLYDALYAWSRPAAGDPDTPPPARTATLVIYATGHGYQLENEWALVPPDHADPLDPRAMLPPAALLAALKDRADLAQVLLVLDACGAAPGGEQALLDALEKSRYRPLDGQFDLWVVAAARRAETAQQTVFSDAFTAALRAAAVPSADQPHLDLTRVMESVRKDLAATSQGARIVAGYEDPRCRALPNPLFMPPDPPDWLPGGWSRSSRGVHSQDAPGWYFTGRDRALRTVLDHLTGVGAAPPLWLTGSHGSGKTAVLGRVVTTATAALRDALPVVARRGVLPSGDLALAAVDARGRTAERLADEIARALKLDAGGVAGLLAALGGGNGGTVRGVVVDHVDEADGPAAVLARLVEPLAALPDVRVVLGAARPPSGPAAGPAVDLDDGAHRGPEAVGAYLRTRLAYGGHLPPEAAGPLERLCGGCFAAAVTAADVVDRERADPVDQASKAVVERLDGLFRRTLGDFLPPSAAGAAADVLNALCSFHDGLFLDLPTWAAVTARHAGVPVTAAELASCLDACRSFLVRRELTGRRPGDAHDGLRPRHQPAPPGGQGPHRAVLHRLVDEVGPADTASGWERVPAHLLDILAAAAADPGADAGSLLDDPGFLLALPRPTMTRTVKALSGGDRAARAAVRNAEPRQAQPHQRRFALALAATRQGLTRLAHAVGPVDAPCGTLEVRWARPGARERQSITRVSAGGRPGPGSVVTAHDDGTLLWWDGGSGEPGPSRQLAGRVTALSALETDDGVDALVVLADGSVLRCAPDAAAPDQVLRAGKGVLPGPCAGHPAGFLAMGDDKTVEMLAVGASGAELLGRELLRETVVATAVAGPPDDPVVWAATLDGVVHRWSPAAGGAPRRVGRCPNPVRLAAAADGGTAVIVDTDGGCTFVGGAAALAGASLALPHDLRAVHLTPDWFVVAGGHRDGNWLDTYGVTDGTRARWPLDGLPTGVLSHPAGGGEPASDGEAGSDGAHPSDAGRASAGWYGSAGLLVATSRAPALLRARTHRRHGMSRNGRRR